MCLTVSGQDFPVPKSPLLNNSFRDREFMKMNTLLVKSSSPRPSQTLFILKLVLFFMRIFFERPFPLS